jgi:hypothetical protein
MSTGAIQPFEPIATVTVAATTSSVAVVLPPSDAILVFNSTSAVAFVVIGSANATSAGTPVPAGGRQLFGGGPYVASAAVVLANGSGSVYFTAGQGTAY